MNREIVVIGGVAAGMSFAAKLHRSAKDVNITVYEKGSNISYGACGLPYYIGDDIKEIDELISKKPDDYDGNIKINILHEVISIDSDKKILNVRNLFTNEEFQKKYDELIIATGSSPILPETVDFDIKNIFKLRTTEDAEQIKSVTLSEDVKNVVIVGGGYIGIELVEAFNNLGKNVSVINRSERIMGSFDEEIREIILKELNEKNINLYLKDEVVGVTKNKNGRVKSVITSQGEYQADLVVVAIGVVPNTDLAKNIGIKTLKNGAIIIDNHMKTNIDNIYAAGDCTALYNPVVDDYMYIPLGGYANKQGRALAERLSRKDISFPGGIGSSIIKVLDLEVGQTGLNENQANQYKHDYDTVFIKGRSNAGYYPGYEDLYVKLIFDKETEQILGGQIIGKKGAALRVGTLALAVQNKMTLTELAYSDLPYAPPFTGVWDPLQVAANVGSKK